MRVRFATPGMAWRRCASGAGAAIAAVFFASAPARAESCGKLCNFENEATKPKPPEKKSSGEDDNDLAAALVEPFVEVIWLAIAEGGANSNRRAAGGSDRTRARDDGEALIPRLRVDLAAQRIDAATGGRDLRIEGGHGALGIQGRLTRYREDVAGAPPPVSRLDLRQAHVLYRMSGEVLEVDFGFGLLQMSGRDTHSAFSFTVPVLVHPAPWFGIEYRPAWSTIAGHAIRDQELALMLGGPYASLRLGYRRVDSDGGTGGAVLQGPFAGLSIRY